MDAHHVVDEEAQVATAVVARAGGGGVTFQTAILEQLHERSGRIWDAQVHDAQLLEFETENLLQVRTGREAIEFDRQAEAGLVELERPIHIADRDAAVEEAGDAAHLISVCGAGRQQGCNRYLPTKDSEYAQPMLAGVARVDITPPLPADLLGYVRRDRAAREVARPLLLTACVIDDGSGTLTALLAADLVGMPISLAWRIRSAVAEQIGTSPEAVLVNTSHTHAAPWPGAVMKLGGEFDGLTDQERAYTAWLPQAFVSAGVQAAAQLRPAAVAGGVGRVAGLAVNRRERTPDRGTILGWNPDGFVDEEVPTIRIDDHAGGSIATIVGFGCHPVVVGPEVPEVDSDFVGPLREQVEAIRGGLCLFLQGAAGNILPLEAFHNRRGPEERMGARLGLEAAHAVADAEPRILSTEKLDYGSVTPISLYRRVGQADQPAPVIATARREVRLPLLDPPAAEDLQRELAERKAELQGRQARGESRVTTNPVAYHVQWLEETLAAVHERRVARHLQGEIWAMRLGECALATAPGEIFSEIGAAVRRASPAAVTIFAGYSQGVLGYVATPEEYPHGGYEPAVSHRGYGHPSPFSPEVAGIVERTAIELLQGLFPAGA